MLEFMAMILLPAVPEGTKEWRSGRKSGERGVKMVRNVTRLQGLALRYWEWENVPEKTQNEFHAKDATIAKRASTSLSFSRIAFQELA